MDEQSGKGNPEELTGQEGDSTEDEVSGYRMSAVPPMGGKTGAGLNSGGKASSSGGLGGSISLGGAGSSQTDPAEIYPAEAYPVSAQIDPAEEDKGKGGSH
jgi:hypothetical protein